MALSRVESEAAALHSSRIEVAKSYSWNDSSSSSVAVLSCSVTYLSHVNRVTRAMMNCYHVREPEGLRR